MLDQSRREIFRVFAKAAVGARAYGDAGISQPKATEAHAAAGACSPANRPELRTELPSVNVALDTVFDVSVSGIRVLGYRMAGDGGEATYRRAHAEPAHPGWFRSADGAWWELASEDVTLRMFGARGDGVADDTDAIAKAVRFMSHKRMPLRIRGGRYLVKSEIIVDGDYLDIIGEGGATFVSGLKSGYIQSVVAPDVSFPSVSSPGPLSGSCFYFTSLIYYSSICGITFSGFRFALSYLEPHNSPIIDGCTFARCNIGVFCYQGSQNYQIINCIAQEGCGTLFVGSATCFPMESPFSYRDNYYTDGLTVANDGGYGALTFSVNRAFDIWFRDSILRPSVKTYTVNYNGYIYPFSDEDACCLASGRAVYAPFRSPRAAFFPTFRRVDLRGPSYGGLALINTSVYALRIDTLIHEGVFAGFAGSPGAAPWLTLGSIVSAAGGVVTNVSTEAQGGSDVGHPFYRFTGQGGYETGWRAISHVGIDVKLPDA